MASKKIANSKLSKSGKYYRDHADARKKKAQTDSKINSKPEQKKVKKLSRAEFEELSSEGHDGVHGDRKYQHGDTGKLPGPVEDNENQTRDGEEVPENTGDCPGNGSPQQVDVVDESGENCPG